MLSECLGVEAEVEFVELYEGQPLFSDVVAFLASKGLHFVSFLRVVTWTGQPSMTVFADGLFLRLPEDVPSAKKAAYRAICEIYGHGDEAITAHPNVKRSIITRGRSWIAHRLMPE